jgi:P-type E1-E2 ATPase
VTIEGVTHKVYVGNAKLLKKAGITLSESQLQDIDAFSEEGKTAILCAIGKTPVAILGLKDVSLVREEAISVVGFLKAKGYTVWMITGDNEKCARAVGEVVGITNIAAGCYPEDKKALVERL